MKPIFAFAFGPQGWNPYEITITTTGIEYHPTTQKPEGYFLPGFVDLHIHGAFGIDFMTAKSAELAKLADQLLQIGYEYFYPTTVTASLSEIKEALQQLPDHSAMPGFHLEGPFLSPKYPGAQPPSAIIEPPVNLQESEWWPVISHPKLKRITLAPEQPGALPLIDFLAGRGVQVSMGHTNATYSQVERAVENGLGHSTHTYNAMSPLHHREVGAVGASLLIDTLNAEVIYDLNHVSKHAADLLFKCKTPQKVVAVSDCTMAHSLPPNSELIMWNHHCVVNESSVRIKESGALAGSKATLLECFQNLAADFGPQLAAEICTITPRKVANLNQAPKIWTYFSLDTQLLAVHKQVT